jgi:hypothetical protein
MPVLALSDDYLARCISATNLYVETYNKNMSKEIAEGSVSALGKEFKADRFKSMSGQIWEDKYEGQIRWKQINSVKEALDVADNL